MDPTSPIAASVALGAAVVLLAALLGAAVVAAWIARRTGLGLAHPALAWLGLEALFFGPGSVALALLEGRPGPAFYLAGAVAAFAVGAALSLSVARRRSPRADGPPSPPGHGPSEAPAPGRRQIGVSLLLGVLALVPIVPDLAAHGIPLLVSDITGARTEIAGLAVQPLRVAWPALAVLCLFVLTAPGQPNGPGRPAGPLRRRLLAVLRRLFAGLVLVAIVAAETLLASRYLLAELTVALVFAWWIAGRRLPRRAVLALAVVGIAAFVGLGAARIVGTAPGRELEVTLERSVSRVILVQPRTLAALQEAIPAETDYFGGLTWLRRLGPLLGRDDIPNLGYWIYPRVVPEPQPVPGYAAPGLIGEAWANFGPGGLGLFVLLGIAAERLGAFVALVGRRRGSVGEVGGAGEVGGVANGGGVANVADIAAASLATLFVARTHALGLNGLAVLLVLAGLWRLLVDRPRGLGAVLGEVIRWRA